MRAPVVASALKRLAGIAPQRKVPGFARESFKEWFGRRPQSRDTEQPLVLLWPDTFHNYFKPHTAQAAVEVLEHAGFRVEVPREEMCCGRPLYDYGMLDEARDRLK